MMHRLTVGIIDPLIFIRFIRYGNLEGEVVDASHIKIEDQMFLVTDPDEVELIPGQKVFVCLSDHFSFETEVEYTQRLLLKAEQVRIAQEQQVIKKEEDRLRSIQRREAAAIFNATIQMPVKWVVGYKAVMSGLTEKSWGDGRNRATVDHILLKEDLVAGRLVRQKEDFLCSANQQQNGRLRCYPESFAYDEDNTAYQPAVTCASCLKIARRWIQEGK